MNNKQILQIAKLAKLQFKDNDLVLITQEISAILNLVDKLQNIDTTDIIPMYHPIALTQRLREDKAVTNTLSNQHQKIAPLIKENYYLVPTVLA